MMPRRRLLVHVLYAILIVLAFLGGRSSLQDRTVSDSASLVTEHPSLLRSVETTSAASETANTAQDKKAASVKTSFDDDFAEQVAEMLKVGTMDYGAFSDVVEAWVDHDPLGAIDFLARGERRDDMLRWIVSVWGRLHPEDASRWLAENEELEGLDHAIEGLTQGIQKDDPESAMKWAKMIEEPSVQTRVLAASGFQRYRHDHEAAVEALADSGLPAGAQEAIINSWSDTWKRTATRNSQNVSSVAAAARAAGAAFDTSSVEAYVEQVRKGVVIESGTFQGKLFGVPNLTMLEGEAILKHLRLQDDGLLGYVPGDE